MNDPKQRKEDPSNTQPMLRLASAGFELASFPLILGAIGYYWLDPWMGFETPFIAIAGVLVGFCLGFYRLILMVNQLPS
ncbi:AtpZ/AtpI family protein [Rhodopirellula sp. P2]|uniref:AtpZ/AtpI family protein n=1 Tax=Rhodopirellula sp. P2 TaxID=2127060 RepID=UPI0023679ED2|nr:AtpZ/AtpI family protein [Rhodopirellula sp. P2]WDQ17586.1 AtpZ/AtpI family protein [Rhodopirellula sp. P2]